MLIALLQYFLVVMRNVILLLKAAWSLWHQLTAYHAAVTPFIPLMWCPAPSLFKLSQFLGCHTCWCCISFILNCFIPWMSYWPPTSTCFKLSSHAAQFSVLCWLISLDSIGWLPTAVSINPPLTCTSILSLNYFKSHVPFTSNLISSSKSFMPCFLVSLKYRIGPFLTFVTSTESFWYFLAFLSFLKRM